MSGGIFSKMPIFCYISWSKSSTEDLLHCFAFLSNSGIFHQRNHRSSFYFKKGNFDFLALFTPLFFWGFFWFSAVWFHKGAHWRVLDGLIGSYYRRRTRGGIRISWNILHVFSIQDQSHASESNASHLSAAETKRTCSRRRLYVDLLGFFC